MTLEIYCKPVPPDLIAHVSMASPADSVCCEGPDAFHPTTLPITLHEHEKVILSVSYTHTDGRFHSSSTNIFEGNGVGEGGSMNTTTHILAGDIEVTGEPNHAGCLITGK